MTRTSFLRRACFAAALGLAGTLPFLPARQPQPDKGPAVPLSEMRIVERVNASTDKALDYLESKQAKDGPGAGSWNTANNAINALSVLAFLSRGHVPGRGKYGDTVGAGGAVRPGVLTLARNYLISTQAGPGPTEGYMANSGGSMYAHGLATLALVELYGQDPDPKLEEAARKAVNCILRSQGPLGGWNYGPSPTDGDLSVSVMQIVAMRAARNAEIPVPQLAIDKAIKYLRHKANPSGPGYGYAGPGAGTPQTSAAGTLSMQLLGMPGDPQVAKTLDWLAATTRLDMDKIDKIEKANKADWANHGNGGVGYFYYYHYYAIQAFYQHGGKNWNEWHPPIRELLLKKQNDDGSWDVPPGTSEAAYSPADNKAYSTALGCLVLNIYQHFLPAYQR